MQKLGDEERLQVIKQFRQALAQVKTHDDFLKIAQLPCVPLSVGQVVRPVPSSTVLSYLRPAQLLNYLQRHLRPVSSDLLVYYSWIFWKGFPSLSDDDAVIGLYMLKFDTKTQQNEFLVVFDLLPMMSASPMSQDTVGENIMKPSSSVLYMDLKDALQKLPGWSAERPILGTALEQSALAISRAREEDVIYGKILDIDEPLIRFIPSRYSRLFFEIDGAYYDVVGAEVKD